VLELIKAFESVSGLKLNYDIGPRRAGDVIKVYADNTKAKTLLGWQPGYDITTMMQTAWNWQQALAKETAQ
jgi:UDP-glucose 4-epimerase